eukprot:269909_1
MGNLFSKRTPTKNEFRMWQPYFNDYLEDDELLLHGYVHYIERKYKMDIPSNLIKIIVMFYPQRIPKFELYSATNYALITNDGHSIKSINSFPSGMCTSECFEYFIYPQCFNRNGYNQGTHYLSIKPSDNIKCNHSFGIISQREEEITDKQCNWGDWWPIDLKNNNVYMYQTRNLKKHDILTMQLDCDNKMMRYFVNDQLILQQIIILDKRYFFVLRSCARDHTTFQIVPSNIYELNKDNEQIIYKNPDIGASVVLGCNYVIGADWLGE